MPKSTEVFTPTSTPTHTYVDRTALGHEQQLRNAVRIPNMVASISGPSKSGKSVLIRKVLSADDLIPVSGSAIRGPDDLWRSVLVWIEAPSTVVETKARANELGANVTAGGSVGVPLVAKGTASGQVAAKTTGTSSVAETFQGGGLAQVVAELAGSDFVVFVDDFHYIPRDIQVEVARQIKAAAEGGVRIVTASVPHRSDDVVRGNPELKGRVSAVDLAYWAEIDLRRIAEQGFRVLNVDLSPTVVDQLAKAAFGSPQLMQTLCLQLCFHANIDETWPEQERLEVDDQLLDRVRSGATAFTDSTSMVEAMHAGPKVRGSERKQFQFSDGSSGDVYRASLLAMATSPPRLSLPYDEILGRIRALCQGDAPTGSSVSEALRQIQSISDQLSPNADVLEWDEDVLSISEPYFLFYLHFSQKLEALGRE